MHENVRTYSQFKIIDKVKQTVCVRFLTLTLTSANLPRGRAFHLFFAEVDFQYDFEIVFPSKRSKNVNFSMHVISCRNKHFDNYVIMGFACFAVSAT